jgi:hypothetical protein
MAGEGSMMHAIKSLKNNRALRKNDRNGWKRLIGSKKENWEDPIQASPELLAEIRNRLQAENKATQRKKIVLTTLILGFILIVFTILNQLYKVIQL